MPPKSNGLAKGHDKPPKQQGPKDKAQAPAPVAPAAPDPKPVPPGQAKK
jgi:hypothetical protein